MLRKIDLGETQAEHPGDFRSRHVLEDAVIERLIMLRIGPLSHPLQGGLKEVLTPFLFPGGVNLGVRRKDGGRNILGAPGNFFSTDLRLGQ